MNFTPQQIVRAAGSRGLPMVTSVLRRRFNSRWNTLETDLISQYFYHITAAPASGEFALNSLLRPLVYRDEDGVVSTSIFAKRTVEQDIQGLPANSLPFPVLLMFGDHDWLRFKNVERFVSFAKSKGICIDYSLIESAGHHLYVDNPDVMHREIELFRTRHNV
jgi:pimeloyl-ACP methyl ester carboxylesterase